MAECDVHRWQQSKPPPGEELMPGTRLKHRSTQRMANLGNRNLFLFLYSNGGVNGALVKNLRALIIRVSLPISFAFIPKRSVSKTVAADPEAMLRRRRRRLLSQPPAVFSWVQEATGWPKIERAWQAWGGGGEGGRNGPGRSLECVSAGGG